MPTTTAATNWLPQPHARAEHSCVGRSPWLAWVERGVRPTRGKSRKVVDKMSKSFVNLFVLTLLGAGLASAQERPIQAGIKVGTNLTDFLNANGNVSGLSDKHIVFGPYLEIRLPFGLGIEADALHESTGYGALIPSGSNWQFPVMAKYRLGMSGRMIKPYVLGGVNFSHLSDIQNVPQLKNTSNFGVVAGAGLQINLLVLRISPEIRYNGWTRKSFEDPKGLFEFNRNQAMVLLGIGF